MNDFISRITNALLGFGIAAKAPIITSTRSDASADSASVG